MEFKILLAAILISRLFLYAANLYCLIYDNRVCFSFQPILLTVPLIKEYRQRGSLHTSFWHLCKTSLILVVMCQAKYFVEEVRDKSGEDIDISSWEREYVEDLPAQENGCVFQYLLQSCFRDQCSYSS